MLLLLRGCLARGNHLDNDITAATAMGVDMLFDFLKYFLELLLGHTLWLVKLDLGLLGIQLLSILKVILSFRKSPLMALTVLADGLLALAIVAGYLGALL